MRLPILLQKIKRTPGTLLDLLYPPRCAACAARLPTPDAPDFCHSCQELLEPIEGPRCEHCSEPYPGILPAAFECPNCAGQLYSFDFAISAWHSNGPLRETVHRFKYGHKIHLRLPLARKLLDTLDDPRLLPDPPDAPPPPWHLVPVPLHPRRLRERRFNQSAELARTLSKLSHLPCLDLLRRTRYTTPQATLTRQQRLQNLAGAFTLKSSHRKTIPSHILLIDDVFTTGSTAHECALALKQAGARHIAVLTVARG